jgi:uncharacterized paraquat-inducible protein A
MTTITRAASRHVALAWCIALLVTGTVLWALPLPDNALGGMEIIFGGMSLLGGFVAGIVALVQRKRS